MIAEVIDSNVERIKSDLLDQGLTYDRLQEDILDHVCCMVEEEMMEGNDFESSYSLAISSIGKNTLKNLQHQTLLLLDKKFQKMKNTSYFIGLTGSILTVIGALFKMMHWPGASILMILGFLLVTFVFLPFYFVLSYKEQAEKPKIIFPIVGYTTLALILIGAIFKIMHWPGASVMLSLSMAMILIGFVPLYIIQVFKKTSEKKGNIAYVVMLLIGISIVVLLWRVNISKYTINRLTEMTTHNIESVELLNKRISQITEFTTDSLKIPEVEKIMQYSDELESLANQMLSGLLASIDQEEVALADVNHWDYRRGANNAFLKNGLAQDFLQLSREFKDYLLEQIKDPVVLKQIEHDFRFSSEYWYIGWIPEDYLFDPIIISYQKITEFKRAIIFSEYLAIRDLLFQD